MDLVLSLFIDTLYCITYNAPLIILSLIGLIRIRRMKARWGWFTVGAILEGVMTFGNISRLTRTANITYLDILDLGSNIVFFALLFVMTNRALKKHSPAIPQPPAAESPISVPPQNPTNEDSVTDDSNLANPMDSAPLKPKKPVFERYETYIVCPDCGSMVAKGTARCDCGYDLRSPVLKTGKKALRYVVPAVLCLCLLAGGFFIGRASMAPDLESQYDTGFDEGYAVGLNRGEENGQLYMDSCMTDAYREGYRTAMKDAKIPPLSQLVLPSLFYEGIPNEDDVRESLAREYGFSISPIEKIDWDKIKQSISG